MHLWQSLFNTNNEVFFEAPVTRVRVPPPKKKPILWMWVALGLLARTVLKMLGLDSLWEKATQSNDGTMLLSPKDKQYGDSFWY